MLFRVLLPELWYQGQSIEAENKAEALKKVENGEGDIIEDDFQYSHTLDLDPLQVGELI